MANKTVYVDALDTVSVSMAIRALESYQKWVEAKTRQLAERVARLGVDIAQMRFGWASLDYQGDDKEITVTCEPTKRGFSINASGHAVCFLEFGAGVYWNGIEPYPGDELTHRPPGVVGIGEYGKGQGKNMGWVFKDSNGNKVFTRGNQAHKPLWHSANEMRNQLARIAKEVFG